MASLWPEFQDVCAVITQSCLARVTDLRGMENFWCSDLFVSETQLRPCAWGALTQEGCHITGSGCELQYWTWTNWDMLKSMRLIQSRCWIQSSQMPPVQQVPVTNALAGAAPLLLSPAGCKTRVTPSSPTRISIHLPGPLTQASCFLSLLLSNYKWQQTLVLNLTPPCSRNVCPSTPVTHKRGASHLKRQPTTSAHVNVLVLQPW